MKRVFDLLFAITGLLILSPLLLLVAGAIAWADGFPILFRQSRVGKNGRQFQLLKFRSMRTNILGARVTAGMDIRVTRLGRMLRRLKIDELPQLWNVLKGEMSFIGPRPEVPDFVNFADPAWHEVLRTRPGITDLASLVYRNEEELLQGEANPETYYRAAVLPAKLELNRFYQSNRSVWLDFKLLLLSARYSFFPAGFDPEKVKRIFTESSSTAARPRKQQTFPTH